MPKVTEIKVLTFQDKSMPVDSLSQEIQALVEHYNMISHEEADVRAKLFTLAFAKKQIEREIEASYIREQQAAAEGAMPGQKTDAPPGSTQDEDQLAVGETDQEIPNERAH